jgi:hypothetical protein
MRRTVPTNSKYVEKPAQYSERFRYMLVRGTFAVRGGKPQDRRAGPGDSRSMNSIRSMVFRNSQKKTMTVVPFTITGTADQPAFTLDLTGKRSF